MATFVKGDVVVVLFPLSHYNSNFFFEWVERSHQKIPAKSTRICTAEISRIRENEIGWVEVRSL
jgi:hypothetical protein